MSERTIYLTMQVGIAVPESVPNAPEAYEEYDEWYDTFIEPIINKFQNSLDAYKYAEIHEVDVE